MSQDRLLITNNILPPARFWTDVVPAPKNLQFSEVTHTSFRATWEHGAPDVALYRIGWTKKGEQNPQFVSYLANMGRDGFLNDIY